MQVGVLKSHNNIIHLVHTVGKVIGMIRYVIILDT